MTNDQPSYGDIVAALGNLKPTDNELLQRISQQLEALLKTIPPPPSNDARLWEGFYDGPAPLANRLGFVPGAGAIRLAFGEQYTPETPLHFRAAVTLADYNAWELYHFLGQYPGVQFWEKQHQDQQQQPAASEEKADGTPEQ